MKKTYNIPTIKIKTFLIESVVTASGSSESNKTVDEKLNEYISANNLTVNNTVTLIW